MDKPWVRPIDPADTGQSPDAWVAALFYMTRAECNDMMESGTLPERLRRSLREEMEEQS
jgi:hypothetical protein